MCPTKSQKDLKSRKGNEPSDTGHGTRNTDTFLMRMFFLFCGVLRFTLNDSRFTVLMEWAFVFRLTTSTLRFTLHGINGTVER